MATDIKPCSFISHYPVVPSALTIAPGIPCPESGVPGGCRYPEGLTFRLGEDADSISYTSVREGGIPESKNKCASITATGYKTHNSEQSTRK